MGGVLIFLAVLLLAVGIASHMWVRKRAFERTNTYGTQESGDSCKAGTYFSTGDIEERLAERVALFKRLCDTAPAIEAAEEAARRDSPSFYADPVSVRRRAVRAQALALLLR